MSPTAGPPNTLTISAVEPPSSLTGNTYATRVVRRRRRDATLLNAVPPEKTTREGPQAAGSGMWGVAGVRGIPLVLVVGSGGSGGGRGQGGLGVDRGGLGTRVRCSSLRLQDQARRQGGQAQA